MIKVEVLHENARIARRFWRKLISLKSIWANYTVDSKIDEIIGNKANFKRLRGSVGRAHIHVDYIVLNRNEEIVVKNLFLLGVVCCLVCCV